MEDTTLELIRRILEGDDRAFELLMRKYQKGVHGLIWRKIGDFHIAEELTQDTFLQVYKKLSTLKDPNRFEGWLYVIANRRCINWIKRNKAKMDRLQTQPIEKTPPEEIEAASHAHHTKQQRETEAEQQRRTLVKTLLAELPESERTVVTLYYLGEMTTEEIGRFLGVSVNTIKSRLRRGRKRLQEEAVVQETLQGVQLSDTLIENVMRQIADLSPMPTPPVKKPILPWAAVGAAAVLVILLGAGSQYLLRFQQPYSFEARSEPTVELVDTPIFLEMLAKPAVRRQLGRTLRPGKNSGTGARASAAPLTTNAWDNTARFSTSSWTQATGPEGGAVYNLFKAADGTIYAAARTGLYRSTPDDTWVLLNPDIPRDQYRVPMTEHRGVLYTVSTDEVFASENRGETWRALCPRPAGTASGLLVTEAVQKHESDAGIALYLALQEKGIFRSTDAGQQWTPLNEGLTGKRVFTVAALGDTLFAGTNRGLYRLGSSGWHQLLADTANAIHALTVDGNNLYVGMGPDMSSWRFRQSAPSIATADGVKKRIFHSADLGASWTDITPTDESQVMNLRSALQVLAVGKTIYLLGITEFRSVDGGKTWTSLRSSPISSLNQSSFPAVAVDEKTFYKADALGVSRTTDAGEAWRPYINGMTGPRIRGLVAFNGKLYMRTWGDLVHSADGGETWEKARFNTHTPTLTIDFYASIELTRGSDNSLYVISIEENRPSLFRASAAGGELIPVPGVPAFEVKGGPDDDRPAPSYGLQALRKKYTYIGAFAVGGNTVYASYKGRLFRWKPGTPEWIDTGMDDIYPYSALAVSGKTVYAGNRNGHLFQSFDGGESWKDITATLPIRFTRFKDMAFAGATICIATDKGVMLSRTGEHWRGITDKNLGYTLIDKFAVDGTTLYGLGDSGAYRLDTQHTWERLSAEPPDHILFFVTSSDRLYVVTISGGMLHIPVEPHLEIASSPYGKAAK